MKTKIRHEKIITIELNESETQSVIGALSHYLNEAHLQRISVPADIIFELDEITNGLEKRQAQKT